MLSHSRVVAPRLVAGHEPEHVEGECLGDGEAEAGEGVVGQGCEAHGRGVQGEQRRGDLGGVAEKSALLVFLCVGMGSVKL